MHRSRVDNSATGPITPLGSELDGWLTAAGTSLSLRQVPTTSASTADILRIGRHVRDVPTNGLERCLDGGDVLTLVGEQRQTPG